MHLDQRKVFPDHIVTTPGGHAEFDCFSSAPRSWHREKNGVARKIITSNRKLVITRVKYSDAGYYQCKGVGWRQQPFIARVELVVKSEEDRQDIYAWCVCQKFSIRGITQKKIIGIY